MSKVIEKTTEKLPKYVRRLTGGTYEARKMINGKDDKSVRKEPYGSYAGV